MLRMTGTSISHPGQIRKTNQDRAFSSPVIGAVADGMGGHKGGEQAATIAIEILSGFTEHISSQHLVDTVRDANRAVFEEGDRPELRGMGTTLVAAAIHPEEDRVTIVNVGDSRCYRFRSDELEQITIDHSLVEELIRQGRITEEDARSHPQRNIVTRALGLTEDIEIDVFEIDAVHGDRLLLCSDGLFNEIDETTIAARLRAATDPDTCAAELVDLAVASGGRDNISVVLLDIVDDADPAAIRAEAESTKRPTPTAAAQVFDTMVIDQVDVDADSDVHGEADPESEPIGLTVIDEDARAVSTLGDRTVEPSSAAPFDDEIDVRSVHRDRSRARWVALSVIATFLVAFLGINWFASSAYFAADQAGEVVIFKGRPGGVLWIDPEVEQTTGVAVEDLAPAGVTKLEQELEFTSLDDAIDFVDQLERVDSLEREN